MTANKQQALDVLNNAIRYAQANGIDLGIAKMFGSRAAWAIFIAEDLEMTPDGFVISTNGKYKEPVPEFVLDI